ncbi:MAG: metal-dependent hydrolase [Patescibacteria group bacterium]|nr:metal-dependent hydrolase [Patescibacteria group bacterium]
MYATTHLALGLIIGKISGDYSAALIGSLAIDIDHMFPAMREKRFLNIREYWKRSRSYADSGRSYFHGIFALIFFSVILYFFDPRFALIFSIAYLGHFFLDALDNSDFMPFYPLSKFNIKGFIPYFSKQEFVFSLILFLVFIIL